MRNITLTLLLLLTANLSTPILAEEKKPNPEREQIRRLQQAKQKVEQENASLQLEKSAAEEKLKSTSENLEKSSRRTALLTRQVTTLEQEKSALSTRLAELEEIQKRSQSENMRLQSLLDRQNKELATGEAKNVQLYKYSVELLERYQSKGFLSSLAQSEPFTGLKKVEIENLLEEYRDKLDAQKVLPATR